MMRELSSEVRIDLCESGQCLTESKRRERHVLEDRCGRSDADNLSRSAEEPQNASHRRNVRFWKIRSSAELELRRGGTYEERKP